MTTDHFNKEARLREIWDVKEPMPEEKLLWIWKSGNVGSGHAFYWAGGSFGTPEEVLSELFNHRGQAVDKFVTEGQYLIATVRGNDYRYVVTDKPIDQLTIADKRL